MGRNNENNFEGVKLSVAYVMELFSRVFTLNYVLGRSSAKAEAKFPLKHIVVCIYVLDSEYLLIFLWGEVGYYHFLIILYTSDGDQICVLSLMFR